MRLTGEYIKEVNNLKWKISYISNSLTKTDLQQSPRKCTSSDLVEPFDPISKRHFSAGDFSSLTC